MVSTNYICSIVNHLSYKTHYISTLVTRPIILVVDVTQISVIAKEEGFFVTVNATVLRVATTNDIET